MMQLVLCVCCALKWQRDRNRDSERSSAVHHSFSFVSTHLGGSSRCSHFIYGHNQLTYNYIHTHINMYWHVVIVSKCFETSMKWPPISLLVMAPISTPIAAHTLPLKHTSSWIKKHPIMVIFLLMLVLVLILLGMRHAWTINSLH